MNCTTARRCSSVRWASCRTGSTTYPGARRGPTTNRATASVASGAGVLVLEWLDHALARGARIHGEITGFGQATDGADMVAPRRRGIARAIRAAANGRVPGYVNTHAPSTPLGDIEELGALTDVFGSELPPFSSVKGLTGHPLGASGAHEAIYTLLMIERGWLAGTPNLDARDPATHGLPLVGRDAAGAPARCALRIVRFRGAAACLAFAAYHDQQQLVPLTRISTRKGTTRMKQSMMFAALAIACAATQVQARDTVHAYPVQVADALKLGEGAEKVGDDVKLYFAGQPHPAASKSFGEFATNKKTNALARATRSPAATCSCRRCSNCRSARARKAAMR